MNEHQKAASKLLSIAALLEQTKRTDLGFSVEVVAISDRTARELVRDLTEIAGLLDKAGESGAVNFADGSYLLASLSKSFLEMAGYPQDMPLEGMLAEIDKIVPWRSEISLVEDLYIMYYGATSMESFNAFAHDEFTLAAFVLRDLVRLRDEYPKIKKLFGEGEVHV